MDWGVVGGWSVRLSLFKITLRARREQDAVQGELTDRRGTYIPRCGVDVEYRTQQQPILR